MMISDNVQTRQGISRVWQSIICMVASVLCWSLMMSGAMAEPGAVRLNQPRIQPDPQSYVERQRQAGREVRVEDVLNILATLSNHPELAAAWGPFATYILRTSSLPPRDRELVILRIGWLCQAAYEWSHHSLAGLNLGMTQAELVRITKGAEAPGWSDFDSALIRATDELHEDSFISDATWKLLASRYNTRQMMDLVFTVGEYNMVSMALNSFGVQLDKDRSGFPEVRIP
jgi:4-carboxymuconolactone decarboxylase